MKLLGLCGSLRAASTNHALLQAAAREVPAGVQLQVFEGLGAIPLFSPDADEAVPAPAPVAALRRAVAEAEGLVIACPEYAHGIPGAFKNALDWIVGSNEMTDKPTTFLAASVPPRGLLVREALIEVLGAMSARLVLDCCGAVPLMGKRPEEAARILAEAVHRQTLRASLEAFVGAIRVR
ncbi:NADPH-dependent FMN reductase [Niveibacterium sp. SC-1]|uniref:NADPH-dependent FMN reductase n=1 Tax=Niveibacterium sp. SC-1 TaxID=3135646 RepID=UPI00311E205F